MDERVMIFVDGSNLLRGIGEEIKIKVNSLKPPDDLVSLACLIVDSLWEHRLSHELRVGAVGGRVIRSYWFGSFEGSEEDGTHLQESLRRRDFEPVLFHKPKRQGKEKRVDLAIAREMLLNAFQHNYQVAVLVAGDEDYLDLVQDIKRFGIRVTGSFFSNRTSPKLALAVDYFHELHIWGEGHKELVAKLQENNPPLKLGEP
jgi:uncharacterized LabA/DUF88 family protein